jgi:hypothetical protein
MVLDPVTLRPNSATGVPSHLIGYLDQLRDSRTSPRAPDPCNLAYYRHWLGRIEALYRPTQRPVMLVALPRGPETPGPLPRSLPAGTPLAGTRSRAVI